MVSILKTKKGHYSVKSGDKVMVLLVCTMSDYALYLTNAS